MSVLWIGRPFKSSSEGGKGRANGRGRSPGKREIDHIGEQAGQPEEEADGNQAAGRQACVRAA